jgi:hypothetical protein
MIMKKSALLLLFLVCLNSLSAQNSINVSVRFLDGQDVLAANWMTMCSERSIRISVQFTSAVSSPDSLFVGVNLSNPGEHISSSHRSLGNWALFNIGNSHQANDLVVINYDLNVNCFPQPTSGTPFNTYTDIINIFDDFDTTSAINDTLWNLDVNGPSGIGGNELTYDLYFPYITPNTANDNNFKVDYIDIYNSLNSGDSVARTISYMSSMSILPDSSRISILMGFSDSIGCSDVLFKDVYLVDENDVVISALTNINSSSFVFPIADYEINRQSLFKFVETFTFPNYDSNCTDSLCSSSELKFNSVFNYGCLDNFNGSLDSNLCNQDITNNYLIRGDKKDSVLIARLNPAPSITQGNEFWDTDFDQNPTKMFRYLIRNDGGDVAKNVIITIENASRNSMFYLPDSNLINIAVSDSTTHFMGRKCTRYVDRDTSIHNFPTCIQVGGFSNALYRAYFEFDFLFPGDSIIIEFPITYCCPSLDDSTLGYSVFDVEKQLNTWVMGVHVENDCNSQNIVQPLVDRPNGLYGFSGVGNLTSNGQHPKQIYLNQIFSPASVDFNAPTNGCGQQLFFTVNNTSFWKDRYGSAYNYQILNFIADSTTTDLSLLQARARFMFQFEFESGLSLVHGSANDIRFYNGVHEWAMDSLVIVGDSCSVGTTIRVYYSIDSLGGGNSVLNFLDFMNTSSFSFNVKGCCCGNTRFPKMVIKSFLAGRDLDCFIPMSKREATASIHCPGCDMVGSTITSESKIMERVSFGFKDSDNDGLADFPLSRIALTDTSYINSHPEISKHFSIPGDTLTSTVIGIISNSGARTLDSLRNRNIFLKYCFLEQKIPHSSSDKFNLRPFKIDVSYQHLGVNHFTSLLETSPLFDTIVHDLRDSILSGVDKSEMLFYDMSEHALASVFGVSAFTYDANDTFKIKVYFKECGNVITGNSITESDNSFLSVIESNMYLTGVNYVALNQFNVYHTIAIAQNMPDSLLDNSLLYFCESQGANHYFQSIYPKTVVSFSNLDTQGTACSKKIVIDQTVYMGGTSSNIFPFEFRPTPDLTSLQISMPGGNNGYTFSPLDSLTSGSTVRTFFSSNCNVPNLHVSRNNSLNSIPATGNFPVQTAFATEQLDSIDFSSGCNTAFNVNSSLVYSGDEFARRNFSFDFLWDFCGLDSTIIFADTVVRSTFNWSTCGPNTPSLSEIAPLNSAINSANPQLTNDPIGLMHSQTRQQCFDVTIRNIQNITESISNFFIYIPESTYLEGFLIDTVAATFVTLPNGSHAYLFNLGVQPPGFNSTFTVCGTFVECAFGNIIDLPLHYGWNCDGYPTPIQMQDSSACSDTEIILQFDFTSTSPTHAISDPVTYRTCFQDTIVFDVINNGAAIDSIQLSYRKNTLGAIVDSVQFFYTDSSSNAVLILPDTSFISGQTNYFSFYDSQINYQGSLQFGQKLSMKLFFTATQQLSAGQRPFIFDYKFSSYCSNVIQDTVTYVPTTYIAQTGGCNSLSVVPKANEQLTCAFSPVSLSAQIANGHAPYTINWTSNPTGFSATGVSVIDTPQTSTYYIVEVIDSSGNSTRDSVLISVITSVQCCIPPDFDPAVDFNLSDTTSLGLGLAGITANNNIVLINGTFTVNSNFYFTLCNNIILGPGAVINVLPGDTLFIGDSEIYSCSDMSKGIHLEAGSALRMISTTVEDAQYGVEVLDDVYLDIDGCTFNKDYVGIYFHGVSGGSILGQYEISNTQFDCLGSLVLPYINQSPTPQSRSFAGIQAEWVGYLPVGTSSINTELAFNNMNFGIYALNSNLSVAKSKFKNIEGFDSYVSGNVIGTGILNSGHNGAYFFTMIGYDDPTIFDFENCYNGIFTNELEVNLTKINMANCDIGFNINSSLNKSVFISQNRIDCNRHGVRLWNNQGAKELIVQNNIINGGTRPQQLKGFSAVACGVSVLEMNKPNPMSIIRNNNISLGNYSLYGIHLNGADEYLLDHNVVQLNNGTSFNKTGICLQGSNSGTISCNDVLGTRSNVTMDLTTESAMRIESSKSNMINCNAMTNMSYGIRVTGPCRGLISTNGSVIRANDFGRHFTALNYSGSADMEAQDLKGNAWFEDGTFHYPGWGAKNFNSINAFLDKYIFDENLPVSSNGRWNRPDSLLIDPPFWFDRFPALDENCDFTTHGEKIHRGACIVDQSGGGGEDLQSLIRIALDSVSTTEFDYENRAKLRQDLYELLLEVPEYLDSSIVLSDFFIAMAGSAIQGLAELDLNMDHLISTQLSLYSMIENNSLEIYNKSKILEDLNEQLNSSELKEEEKDSIILVQANLIENIQYLISYNQNAMDAFLLSLNYSIEDLIAQNEAISTNGIYLQNHTTIKSINLSLLSQNDQEAYLLTQSEQIREVADQCPLTGGPAVYRARSLYARIFPDHAYEDELECLQSGYAYRTNSEKVGNSFVFPNPAKNEITIRYSYENVNIVEVVNAMGIVILNFPLEANSYEIKINTENWIGGIYFYRILDFEGKLIDVNRFVILK